MLRRRPPAPPPQDNGDGVAPPPRALVDALICEGQYVVLEQQSDKSALISVRASGCVCVCASACTLRAALAR
jgi:hypothetical protein